MYNETMPLRGYDVSVKCYLAFATAAESGIPSPENPCVERFFHKTPRFRSLDTNYLQKKSRRWLVRRGTRSTRQHWHSTPAAQQKQWRHRCVYGVWAWFLAPAASAAKSRVFAIIMESWLDHNDDLQHSSTVGPGLRFVKTGSHFSPALSSHPLL